MRAAIEIFLNGISGVFIGLVLIYLAINRQYEPLLLLPIAFGSVLTNLPLALLMELAEGLLCRFYHYGIEWEVIPPLIFLGLGALTDFGPMLAQSMPGSGWSRRNL